MAGRGTAARTLLSILLAVLGVVGLAVAPVLAARPDRPLVAAYTEAGPLLLALGLGASAALGVAVGAKRTALVLSAGAFVAALALVKAWGVAVLAGAGVSALAILIAALLVPRLDDD